MKFIFLLSLLFISAVVSQSPPESLLVTHPPFIAVGSLSPSQNVGVKGIESDITTNYQEMLTDHTKKLITVGAPEHINVDDNLLIEKKYEDPVFVNKHGQEITASEAVAESQEAVDDGELARIEAELAASQAETASQAHDLIMSKHSEVLKFLSTIAHTERTTATEDKILDQVKRYLKLLKDRHFLIRDKAEEDIVQDLEIKIHEITFAIDQNDYQQKKLANKMKPINAREAHQKMDLEADQVAELAEKTLERGPEQVDNAVIAVLKVEYVAQRNTKVQQLRLLQDLCTAEVPFRNREAQSQHFDDFKVLLDAENKRLTQLMDNYDALIVLFKDAAAHLNDEESDELEFTLQAIADHQDTEENVYKTITLAQDALEKEDVTACETKLILGQGQVQEHLDSTILSFESVVAQQAILRKAAKQIVDGASWSESGSLDIDDLVEEVLKRQGIIKFTPEIEEKTQDVLKSMRQQQYPFAISKMLDIVSKAKANGYTNILKDKNPVTHTDADKISINADKFDQKIYRLSDQASGYIKAGSWGSAFIRVELAGDQLQKRSKVKLLEKAAKQAEKADDPVALEEIVTGLKQANTAELENLVAQKQSLAATKETLQTLQHRVEELESFEDARQEVKELTQDKELTAQVRDSVLKAYQEINMNNRNMTRKYLVEAEDRVIIRESELDFASDSLERQQNILNELLEEAEDAGSNEEDVSDAEEELLGGFDKLKDEIQNHQNLVASDNNVQERVAEIFQHLMFEEAAPAAEKLRTLVGETIGFRPESVVEKQERQIGDDLSKNQVAPDDEEPFTPTQRMVEEIASDAAAAIDTINQLVGGQVSKEAAQLEVEQLEQKIQRAEKLDDIKTTKAKLNSAQDDEDTEAELEAVEDLVVSIEEEKVTLELLQSKCEAVRSAILDAQDQIENGEETNTKLAALLQEIKTVDGSDAGVKEFVQQAVDSLALDNKEKASLDLESAKDHLDRVENDYQVSLDAIGRQLGYLHDAKDAINNEADDQLENLLAKIHQSVDQQQLIFLTDKDARANRDDAIREIVEGRVEDAVAAVQKLSDNADASLNELVEEVHQDGEQQLEAAEEAVDAAEEAEEALEDPENVEGAQRAIEETAEAAQQSEKTEAVQEVKEDLAENEDESVIDELIETVEQEKEALEDEKETLEETQEQLEETAEQIENAESTPAEIEDELDEVDEEELDAEALNAVQNAAEAAEEGDLETAQQEIEDAAETAEEKQRDLEQSEELVERQVEKLEEAKEELADGNTEEALELVQEVQDDAENQEVTRVNEDIEEAAKEGVAAVAEGDADEALEAVEEIKEGSEDAVEEAEDEAAEEEAEQERAEELAAAIPEEADLEVAAGEVNALLNAVDSALHKEDFLRAQQLVEEFDSEGDNFTEETQQELLEAIQDEDVERAHALVQEIREAVNDTSRPTEYEFVKLPKSARNHKAKKSKQAKKQKVMKH